MGARLCQCAGFRQNAGRRDRLHLDVLGSFKAPISLLILERDMRPFFGASLCEEH